MRLLFLTSVQPSFGHYTAARTVLANLLLETAQLGHEVAWLTVQPGSPEEPEAIERLAAAGAAHLGDMTDEIDPHDGSLTQRIPDAVSRYLTPRLYRDRPRFRNPDTAMRRLLAFRPDVAVLHGDSWFEHLLPYMAGLPCVAYLGRPRYAAALSRAELLPTSFERQKLIFNLRRSADRHFSRMRRLARLSNFCALDTALYRDRGLPCRYIPNTWPDAFGERWQDRREAAERAAAPGGILGNIGGLTATGNYFGMRFLGAEILPRLERLAPELPWHVSICGRGSLPDELARQLHHPRVQLKGFVPDIDAEVLANEIFLLCNNAGPYTGGYTRVIYVMASGGCLVGHRRLAESMPEVVHGENALLGNDADEIAANIRAALRDPDLRRRIGEGGRRTYLARYQPAVVASQLAELAAEALADTDRGTQAHAR